jgi:hypothetical protein
MIHIQKLEEPSSRWKDDSRESRAASPMGEESIIMMMRMMMRWMKS